MRALVAALLVSALLAPARAEEDSPEKSQARVLLSQGNALFERGDLRAALADFRAAYALYPSPKLLVNAAAAERELGDAAGAATDLRHFLDDATEEDMGLVDKARVDLRALERKVGRIGLAPTWPPHTTVEIDGRAARDPTYVKPGAHAVKVRAPSGVELSRDVDVSAGGAVVLAMPAGARLAAAPTPAPLRATPPNHKHRPAWVVPVAVVGALLVAGGVTAGVYFGLQSSGPPLSGSLGTFPVSSFK